jgi:hypothetical protein
MEKKKVEHQKGNLTTTESQEQPDQLIALSNPVTFAPIGSSNIMNSSGGLGVSAKEVYDAIFGLLEIKKDHTYKIGDLIKHFRERDIDIKYVGKTKMPPGDVDFSISEEFTSGFRQRFLENVLFETTEEKNNFEAILKIIDKKVTIGQHVTIDSNGLEDSSSYLTIFGSYEDSPDPVQLFVLEIPY